MFGAEETRMMALPCDKNRVDMLCHFDTIPAGNRQPDLPYE